MKHFTPLFVLLLSVFCLFSGCDRGRVPGLVQFEGIVIYNGEPLTEAMIGFHPTEGGRFAYALTDAAGRFSATTIDPSDGIVKGQYKVTVAKYVVVRYIQRSDGPEAVAENMLPSRFETPDATPLTLDVTARNRDARIEFSDAD